MNPGPRVINYRLPRMEHQKRSEREAFRQYLECKRTGAHFGYGFLFPPGTGKTAAAINTVRRILLHEGSFKRILIVCPPVVVPNWRNELLKFSEIEPRRIRTLADGLSSKLKKFVEQSGFDQAGRKVQGIYITNYERLVYSEELYDVLRRWEPELIVIDESHRLKNPKAKRTRAVEELCNPAQPRTGIRPARPTVLLLTGTPILNTLLDVFSQWLCLDGGESFGDNYFAFRARYFRAVNLRLNSQRTFLKWVPRKGSEEKIRDIMARKSMSVRLEDCLDLPPLIKKRVEIDMSAEQARHYDEMKRQLITYIESRACVAQLAITKALRLMQIASGFVKMDDGTVHVFKTNTKLAALEQMIEDVTPSRKMIVWAVFRENYKMIQEACARLNVRCTAIHGELDNEQKRRAEHDFQNDPGTRLLYGHPGSGGIGINLTAGSYTAYYSSNFSKENRDQSAARDYRKGSERHSSITHVDLVMRGTIEEDILKKLDEKNEISLSILRGLI